MVKDGWANTAHEQLSFSVGPIHLRQKVNEACTECWDKLTLCCLSVSTSAIQNDDLQISFKYCK